MLTADGTYRTRFGPCVRHNGHIYANSPYNLRYGFRRIAALRFPEHPGRDDLYLQNQLDFIHANQHFLRLLQLHIAPAFQKYKGWYIEAREHYDDPHPKRDLRVAAWLQIHADGEEAKRLWLRKVLYKMKKNEIAKFQKYARMIADLGVAASLQGFRSTDFMKKGMQRPFHYHGGTFQFVSSPKISALRRVFQNLIDPTGTFYFAYFSDDACLSIRHRGEIHVFNIDISKCDASHGNQLFAEYVNLAPPRHRDDFKLLVEQLNVPMEIRNPLVPSEKVKLRSTRTRLLSGSTITTTINNLASILIGLAVTQEFDGTIDSIHRGAANVGYKVTAERCPSYSDIQFLKNSPVYDTAGRLHPCLNLAVFLRSSGVCRGDLPGSKNQTLQERAQRFQASLIQGMFPRTHSPFISKLRQSAGNRFLSTRDSERLIAPILAYKRETEIDELPVILTDAELFRRYNLSPLQVAQLNEFAACGCGDFAANSGLSAVLMKDYDGLQAPVIP